jgi:acyl-CoA synthetase (AMP-forming)/AMP-acid ligase II
MQPSRRTCLYASLALSALLVYAPRARADTLTITSTPPGARIEIDGLLAGTTPYETLGSLRQHPRLGVINEGRVVDDEGREVAPGEVGELTCRGPYTLRGYYGVPEYNARQFSADGFYHSGDLMRLHPSGNYVVEGRKKDLINRGGEKISAEDVENLAERQRSVLAKALDDEASVEVEDRDAVRQRIELGVELGSYGAERVEIGHEVAAYAVQVDELLHPGLLDEPAVDSVTGTDRVDVGVPAGRVVGDAE